MKFFFLTSTLLLLVSNLFSQRGKDGVLTLTVANTIVNGYTSVTADINAGSTTINVTSSAGYTVGDLVYIVQMQGARVNAQYDSIFGDINNSMSLPNSNNLDYGDIKNYNNCGNNEFAEITSIPNGTSIVLDCGVKNNYTYSYLNYQGRVGGVPHTVYGKIQVVKVPRYTSLTINGGGSITCPQWNGTTGGIVLVEVQNNTTLNGAGAFDVSGKGFRGGAKDNAASVFGGNKWGALNKDQGGIKGESVFGDTTMYKDYAAFIGRGAIANGGGGGDAHNAGGGGGSNGGVIANYNGYGNPATGFNTIWDNEGGSFHLNTSSGGGRGGYTFSQSNQNLSTYALGAVNWGGDKRRNFGGLGGRPLDYSTGKVFIAGGGGAGDGNENQAGAGGNGGGLVYVVCYGNLSGAGTILANGADGITSSPGCGSNDGGGGGGGGGTILLKVNGSISLTAPTALSAFGGKGGNVNFNCVLNNSTGYGPGGGGGGGYIFSTGSLPSNNVTGGNNGIQTGNSSNISTSFPPNGATIGGVGSSSLTAVNYSLTVAANSTICIGSTTVLTASSTNTAASINWYDAVAGGNQLASGTSTYAPATFTAIGTYTYYAGTCPGTYREPIIITVTNGIAISVNSPTICAGSSAVLTATSAATNYTWSSGATNTSTINTGAITSTTNYTVSATSAGCVGSKTVDVVVTAAPAISITGNTTICSGNSTVLTASGANTYTWVPFSSINTSTISLNPTTTSNYSVVGTVGTCTGIATATINVTTTPTITGVSTNTTICPSQTLTLNANGASTYTWLPTNATGATFTIAPASSTTVAVIGANGTCTAQVTTSITVSPAVTLTVNNPTICVGGNAVLTATSSATSYTWSANAGSLNTVSVSVSPTVTTNYTISGTVGSCVGSQTTNVNVVAQPTLAITGNAPICSGNTSTLTLSGNASTYTLFPSSISLTTGNFTVNPSSTTTYTVFASNGVCTNSATSNVSVTTTPTITGVINSTICPTQTATFTANGAASFTWQPGNFVGATYTISPLSDATVSVVGANGTCTAQTTASVTLGSNVTILVPSATICPGQTTTLTASGVSTFTWSSNAGSVNTASVSVSPTITATYTVSGNQGLCSGTQTVQVSIIAQPTLAVSGNTNICSGGSTSLSVTGSATTFTWLPSNSTATSITVSPSSNGLTTYTAIGDNGYCTNSTASTVSVTATPTLTGISNVTICTSQTASFTASGASTFTWQPNNVTGANYTIAPSTNTTISVIGANGTCTSQAVANITIGSNISININNPTICAGQVAVLTPTSSSATYSWSTLETTNTISVTPTSTSVYTVYTTGGSCSGMQTVTVTVNAIPVLTVTSNDICSGANAVLNVTGADTYTWSNTVNGGSQNVSPTTTTSYSVSGTNLTTGCESSAYSTTVNVTATPTITGVTNATVCANQTATFTASGANTFTWQPGNVIGANFSIPSSASSTVLVVGSNGLCTASATASIIITPGVAIALTNTAICEGSSAVLTPTSSATSYSWSTNQTSTSITVSPTTTTTYTVYSNDNSCAGSQTIEVTVLSTPVLTVTSNNICKSPNSNSLLSATGANTYTWSNGYIGNSQNLNPIITTTYGVIGTSGNGCVSLTEATTTVVVTPPPNPYVPNQNICAGQTATLIVTGATTYTWITTSGLQYNDTITDGPLIATTIYSIIATSPGCSYSAATPTVYVTTPPSVVITTTSQTIGCADLCIDFTETVTPSNSTISYNFGDGNTSLTNNPQHCFTTNGNYIVTATATSTLPGCATTYTLPSSINVILSPVANFSITEGNSVSVGTTLNLINTSVNNTTNVWTLCDGSTLNQLNAISLAKDTGDCCIKLVTTNATCKDSMTHCIKVLAPVIINIPNVFTPNGDSNNDVFKVTGNGIKTLSCTIFDRWGLKMSEFTDINGGWNGTTTSGVSVSSGTYFYIIKYTDLTGTETTTKGTLNIFKD